MAKATPTGQCSICFKKPGTFICGGCLQNFCHNDLTKHVQNLGKELDGIENDHDEFRQILNDQKNDSTKRSLIQEIDKWEEDSINNIKQTAEECRQELINYTNKFIIKIENKLDDLAKELKQTREEHEFNEIHLNRFKQNLNKLKQELDKPSSVSIQQESSKFINKIFVISPCDKENFQGGLNPPQPTPGAATNCTTTIGMNTRWEYKGFTVAGGNGAGYGPHQLNNPQGLYVDDDQTVYIADEKNYRIVAWKRDVTSGQVAAGLNGKGKRTDQFNDPRYVIGNKKKDSIFISDTYNKRVMRWLRENGTSGETIISEVSCSGLTMDDNGFLYITDIDKHEVRRYQEGQTSGVVVAGGNGKGSGLNQLSYPTYVFVDQESSVYVSDEYNHRVMKWEKDAKEGIIVAGGDGYGYGLTQLYNPQGVIVDQWGTVYVADMYNHRIMRWPKGTPQGNIIAGGNNKGGEANQLNSPKGLSFDRQGNLYVVDNGNYRVQKFNINPSSCS